MSRIVPWHLGLALSLVLLLLLTTTKVVDGYLSPVVRTSTRLPSTAAGWSTSARRRTKTPFSSHVQLQLFRKDEKDDGNKDKSDGGNFLDFLFGKKKEEEVKQKEKSGGAAAAVDESSKAATPISQVDQPQEQKVEDETKQEEVPVVAAATTTTPPATPAVVPSADVDAVERARQFRAQAERMRLEAERMDAELTLDKISRLERDLAAAQRAREKHLVSVDSNVESGDNSQLRSRTSSSSSSNKVEEIQREMEVLRAKIRGEKPAPPVVRTRTSSTSSGSNSTTTLAETSSTFNQPKISVTFGSPDKTPKPGPYSQENFELLLQGIEKAPDFFKKIMASLVELDYEDASSINVTEVAVRMEQLERMDLSFSNCTMPEFTNADIERAKNDIRDEWWFKEALADVGGLDESRGNETELALRALAYEHYMIGKDADFVKVAGEEWWLKDMVAGFNEAMNKTSADRIIETLYPQCTRKEGMDPTLEQVQLLVSEVLPKASFVVSGRPEKVSGGYILRGKTRSSSSESASGSGDALIAAIDRELVKLSLQDKMTVFYAMDFAILGEADEDFDFDFQNIGSVLYVTGKDVARESKKIPLTLVTALGVATSWYLSLYPFMLNEGIMTRVDEQIALADSNMAYDLSWLTDLSMPMFFTFMAIQITHEMGHRFAAGLYNTTLSVPTFVPSLVTGMTSTVTTFKDPPKNHQAMFDISIAGPLAGIFTSLLALTVGSQLTSVTDPATLPALPLEILRQSALGGGVINAILGNNVLGLPSGVMQAAAGMTVGLHPVAIAGFFGLVVNALSLLPIGTTDGGRISLAMVGRAARPLVGQICLVGLLFAGFLGSDLFLFYYAFVLAFQTGNEIPSRNEVDPLPFSRTLVAIASFALAFLALVPFQN